MFDFIAKQLLLKILMFGFPLDKVHHGETRHQADLKWGKNIKMNFQEQKTQMIIQEIIPSKLTGRGNFSKEISQHQRDKKKDSCAINTFFTERKMVLQ